MTSRGGSPWADLPEEILDAIGSRIDRRVEVFIFRSVCYSWRSAVPTPDFGQLISLPEARLPYPGDVDGVIAPATMCCVQFPAPIPNDDDSISPADAGGWLMKIEETNRGKLQLINPISNLKLRFTPDQLNLAEFRVVQLSTTFRLKMRVGFTGFLVNKVVPFPSSASPPPQQPAITVISIFQEGKLGYWRTGDKRWTLFDGESFDYDDVVSHRGQLYVVDRLGKLSRIDSSLRLVESYSPPRIPDGGGGQKSLVESGGDLYLVDRYLDGKRRDSKDVEVALNGSYHAIRYLVGTRRGRKWNPRAVDFKVYKLDEEMAEWVEVKSLGNDDDDRLFVLTTEGCFSAPAALVAGGKKNCIY